jgi:glycine oxidase
MSGAAGKVVIAGAGLIGRLMAMRLLRRGWRVTLYDPFGPEARSSAAYTGAGMLAPYCELESAETLVSELGRRSIAEWRALLSVLERPVALAENGTLVVAHGPDQPELERLERRARGHWEAVRGPRLAALEPELVGFGRGLYFAGEGHINNRELLLALGDWLQRQPKLDWHHQSWDGCGAEHYLDCRGLGSRNDDPELRGVRGELLYVRAPEVQLRRAVRLMHPRYPLYVVPRAAGVYVIGATQIESEERSGITVRSALELLSALYSLHSGFAEAEVLESSVNCRPAYPDNLPRITLLHNGMRINGLFRHGFLLAPRITDLACRLLEGQQPNSDETRLVRTLP